MILRNIDRAGEKTLVVPSTSVLETIGRILANEDDKEWRDKVSGWLPLPNQQTAREYRLIGKFRTIHKSEIARAAKGAIGEDFVVVPMFSSPTSRVPEGGVDQWGRRNDD